MESANNFFDMIAIFFLQEQKERLGKQKKLKRML